MKDFASQLSASYNNLVDKIGDWINDIILQIPNLIIAAIILVFVYMVAGYVRKFVVKAASRATHNQTVLNLVSNLTAVVLGLLAILLALSVLNLGSTINKILATAGVLGLAVGLALQDPMNNLFSGVFMSVKNLYRIGDLIETNGYFGNILSIDLRTTKLKTPKGQEVIIPNKDVVQNPLKNFTITGSRRIDVPCGVSYGDDLEKVEKVTVEAIKQLPNILADKDVSLVYNEFGGSSINFIVRFWIDSTKQLDFLVEQSNAIKAIKAAYDQHDITIPFPIQTIDFDIKGGVALDKMLQSATENGQSEN